MARPVGGEFPIAFYYRGGTRVDVSPPESVSASVPGFTQKTQHAIASERSTRHEIRKLPGARPSTTHHAAIGV
jgi:hypothetical protein